VAAALLCGGLLAVGGGVGGLLLAGGHHGISPRPAARPDRPPAGVVAAPPRPATAARVSRPVYLSIPVIGVHTRLIRLGLTARGTMQAKDHFPTQQIYGPVPGPELRLITCGGTFDAAIGSYLSNVVVYAAQIR